MAYRETNGYYYTDRNYPGFGRVKKSLQTRDPRTADARESLLHGLAVKGRHQVVQAWVDGKITAEVIAARAAAGTLGALQLEPGTTPLKRAIPQVLEEKEETVAESTLERYRTGLGHFVRVMGEDTSVVDALTTLAVDTFKGIRLEREGAAPATVNNDLIAVSVLATSAEERGWIVRRPRITWLRTEARLRELTAEQEERYLSALPAEPRLLMRLLLETGIRLGEVERVRVSDLDQERGFLFIAGDEEEGSGRIVSIPPQLAADLGRWVRERGLIGRARIFRVPRRTLQKLHRSARCQAGIKDYTINDHRHTFGLRAARAGVGPVALKEQLGHSSWRATELYFDHAHHGTRSGRDDG